MSRSRKFHSPSAKTKTKINMLPNDLSFFIIDGVIVAILIRLDVLLSRIEKNTRKPKTELNMSNSDSHYSETALKSIVTRSNDPVAIAVAQEALDKMHHEKTKKSVLVTGPLEPKRTEAQGEAAVE